MLKQSKVMLMAVLTELRHEKRAREQEKKNTPTGRLERRGEKLDDKARELQRQQRDVVKNLKVLTGAKGTVKKLTERVEVERNKVAELEEYCMELEAQLQQLREGSEDSDDDLWDNEGALAPVTSSDSLREWLRNELDPNTPASAKNAPYPGELVLLYQDMMMKEVSASQATGVVRSTLETFADTFAAEFADCATVRLPDATNIRDWRRGLDPLGTLQAAVMFAKAKTVTLHADATSKDQIHFGSAVLTLEQEDGTVDVVMASGVWSTATGESVEGAECVFSCGFDRMRAELESARAHLARRKLRHHLPEPKSLADMTVAGLIVRTQQDHANAAQAQERVFGDILKQRVIDMNYNDPINLEKMLCWDHKRINFLAWFGKGDHNWVTEQAWWAHSRIPTSTALTSLTHCSWKPTMNSGTARARTCTGKVYFTFVSGSPPTILTSRGLACSRSWAVGTMCSSRMRCPCTTWPTCTLGIWCTWIAQRRTASTRWR